MVNIIWGILTEEIVCMGFIPRLLWVIGVESGGEV